MTTWVERGSRRRRENCCCNCKEKSELKRCCGNGNVTGKMTHAAYQAIGGVHGALAQHADETLARLTADDPAREQAIQRVMVQLVQPGAGAEDTRRVARRTDLGAMVGRWYPDWRTRGC
jgi:hypothetical protein